MSQGPPVIAVPTIAKGTPADQAEKTLTDKGFKVTPDEQYSDDVTEGGVISVSPSDKARKFSTVTLTVSRGPEMVTVPDIPRGTSLAKAEQLIRDAHLVPVVSRFPGTDGTGGLVLGTTPDKGEIRHAGSTVTLFVF